MTKNIIENFFQELKITTGEERIWKIKLFGSSKKPKLFVGLKQQSVLRVEKKGRCKIWRKIATDNC